MCDWSACTWNDLWCGSLQQKNVSRTCSEQKVETLQNFHKFVRFELLTAVVMDAVIFWDIALCSPYVNRRFGGTYHLHLQGRKSDERNRRVAGGWAIEVKVKVKVILRPTVSRPVCPGVRPPSGPVTNFSFSLKFPLDSCGFVIL
jgi:hypothetical protein